MRWEAVGSSRGCCGMGPSLSVVQLQCEATVVKAMVVHCSSSKGLSELEITNKPEGNNFKAQVVRVNE